MFGIAIFFTTNNTVIPKSSLRWMFRALPWLIITVAIWAPWELRSDISATIIYAGKYDEISLDCTNMYGSFINHKTKKGEIVEVDSA